MRGILKRMEKKGGDTLDSNFVYDDTTDNDYYIITNNDEIDGSLEYYV